MKDKRGEEFGHLSEIEGIVADEPQKIRGDRVERLFYEEAGSDKHFQKKYLQGEALITVMGGRRIGTRIAWGTGGDSGPALSGIRHMTNNPEAYNVLLRMVSIYYLQCLFLLIEWLLMIQLN